jgi:NAD(P)H dehydrogenase (quinone)
MYAVMGITGRVGGAAAKTLQADGQSVRAIVRDPAKARSWVKQGAELVVADYREAKALRAAFTGVEGVFAMIPPHFAPSADFREARAVVAALRQALDAARPPKAVYLSSIGSHLTRGLGLITQTHILEEELGSLPITNAFLRPAWFMENSQSDILTAREKGEIAAFLQPPDRAIAMISTTDIGRIAGEVLQQTWSGNRNIEMEGPSRYSPNDLATVLASLLGRPVRAVTVPRNQWQSIFASDGTEAARTAPRIEMLDGFNSGWIDFEGRESERVVGQIRLEEALRSLL